MKSTLKIDYQSGLPVIKIVQPVSVLNPSPDEDVDPKDTLLAEFLKKPINTERNYIFALSSYYEHPNFDNATHHITNIMPVEKQDMLSKIKSMLYHEAHSRQLFLDEEISSLFNKIYEAIKLQDSPERV